MNDLKKRITTDGSLSLYSMRFEEGFHSAEGAFNESIKKYLLPAQLDQFSPKEKVFILDVCMGMGYNSGCIIEELFKNNNQIEWHGLELDQRPLELGLNEKIFRELWSIRILNFFNSLKSIGKWIEGNNKGTIHWGDARQKILEIKDSLQFDLILLDPFSPQKCPELWTEQFISLLSKKLSINGRLITYSSASSVRASLRKAGLKIYSISPIIDRDRKWSSGTVAVKTPFNNKKLLKSYQFRDLSLMELEHLKTRSSIPYRDPTGKAKSREIISIREIEQSKSQLIKTSSWRKRWNPAQ